MSIKPAIAALALAALLSACASPVKYDTPSGKPQGRFPGVGIDRVSQELIRRMTNVGGTLVQQTPNQLIFQKKAEGTMVAVVFGTNYDRDVYAQLRFTLYQTGDATEVVGECAMVSNAGSAFEKQSDWTHSKDCSSMQVMLDQLSQHLAAH